MIKETHVLIKLNSRNIKRLLELGYKIPQTTKVKNSKYGYEWGTTVDIRICDLSQGSKIPVTRVCEDCGKEEIKPYREILLAPLCKSCRSKGSGNQFYGKHHSKETIDKIRNKNRKLKDGTVINFIDSIDASACSGYVADKLGISPTTIAKIVNRNDRRDLFYRYVSGIEQELRDLVQMNYPGEVLTNYRKLPNVKELDIYLPELGIAFEMNGLHWHSEAKVPKSYHFNKYKACLDNNVKLYTIWEDQWLNNNTLMRGFIQKLITPTKRLYARKCEICTDKTQIRAFIQKHHIQGICNLTDIYLGLTYNGNIVMAVTVGKHHRNTNKDLFILNRVCFSEYSIVGGLDKLLRRLPRPLISWSDNCYSPMGDLYKNAGFTLEAELKPDYFYTKGWGIRISKQSMQKANTGCPKHITEAEFAREQGLYRIWDCGKKRWKLT
ncbi:MAG: hypothetical protein DRN81_03210 [Thermoproteota archaeon]|nr:MAG: hypothetical protein DRN81_03210 [Candidatus Korarchaeota archaeon]